MYLVCVSRIELPTAGLIRRDDDYIGRVKRLDEAPVIRLGTADARREVVSDEERTGNAG
jgi:hypothetical protein